MMITDLIPLDSKRKGVYIDHQYAFPLYLSELRKYHIEADMELTEALYEEIHQLIVGRIRERALYLIGDQARTERNVRQKLQQNHYAEPYISEALQMLKEYHYIDDEDFARQYAENMRDFHGKTGYQITQGLYQKGVPADIIRQVMEEHEEDETALIERAIRKKGYDPKELPELDSKSRQKLYRFLQSRGFSSDSIGEFFHF